MSRETNYHKQKYTSMMISPARVDPFADGKGSSYLRTSIVYVVSRGIEEGDVCVLCVGVKGEGGKG